MWEVFRPNGLDWKAVTRSDRGDQLFCKDRCVSFKVVSEPP